MLIPGDHFKPLLAELTKKLGPQISNLQTNIDWVKDHESENGHICGRPANLKNLLSLQFADSRLSELMYRLPTFAFF
jgi:hypothetical protein